jgi:acetyl esterase/lipase
MNTRTACAALLLAAPVALAGAQVAAAPTEPGRHRVEIQSSADGTAQPSYLYLPDQPTRPAPLAVLLHTWSSDLEQRDSTVEAEARARGWILLAPDFRGRNDHPEACGSSLAQQDILDAVAWVRGQYPVDGRRIYLLGLSGGGYMTMLMAARHPDPWAAASAWVGISDLRRWYEAHDADRYGEMMRGCFGGAPSDDEGIAAEFRIRSPITHLGVPSSVPMDLAAGRSDEVVDASHTLRAFQTIAPGAVSDAEVDALLAPGPGLPAPSVADTTSDPVLGRRILLRRSAGSSRVTIFEGGHEWLPRAAIIWLAGQAKP